MNKAFSFYALAAALGMSALLVVGCSSADSADSDETASEASDVRTARCPETIDMAFGKAKLLEETPTEYHDGTKLSGAQVELLEARMKKIAPFDELNFSFKLDRKRSGRCYYEDAHGRNSSYHATFRTKSGKNILDIYFEEYRAYAFPTEYSKDGLVFDREIPVGLFANIPASGPYGDGASLNVRIGETRFLTATQQDAADRRFIAEMADEIGEYFHYDDYGYQQNIVPIRPQDLPTEPVDFQAKGRELAEDEALSIKDSGYTGGAEVSDEVFRIVREGRTIGYVIPVDHWIDDGLWDGSGTHYYLDIHGTIVDDVPWTG